MADTATREVPATYVGTSKVAQTEYPLIDNDPHFKRVVGYARPVDYLVGLATAAAGPAALYAMEKFQSAEIGRGGYPKMYRLAVAIGVTAGFTSFYQRSTYRFYGMSENSREIEMDMREMVDKVKAGEPLYGHSNISPYLQGVAARQSRYSALMTNIIPWANFVNHNQHGVDTAKYYQQAERELEASK